MTFKQQLDKVKKHVKPASRETYLRNIRRLRKATGQLPIPSTSKWLTEARLLKWYDSQPLNIRRHLSTAAKVAFKPIVLDGMIPNFLSNPRNRTTLLSELSGERPKRVSQFLRGTRFTLTEYYRSVGIHDYDWRRFGPNLE